MSCSSESRPGESLLRRPFLRSLAPPPPNFRMGGVWLSRLSATVEPRSHTRCRDSAPVTRLVCAAPSACFRLLGSLLSLLPRRFGLERGGLYTKASPGAANLGARVPAAGSNRAFAGVRPPPPNTRGVAPLLGIPSATFRHSRLLLPKFGQVGAGRGSKASAGSARFLELASGFESGEYGTEGKQLVDAFRVVWEL